MAGKLCSIALQKTFKTSLVLVLFFSQLTLLYHCDADSSINEFCDSTNLTCLMNKYGNLKLPRIDPVKVGHVRVLNIQEGKSHEMKTLSMQPPIFEIKDFLSPGECEHIITVAKQTGMAQSTTMEDSIDFDIQYLKDLDKEDFFSYDKNDDGHLDITEMRRLLDSTVDVYPSDEDILRMFTEINLDINKNEKITYQEFAAQDKREMAKFIKQIKDQKPQTKSRFSEQVFLQQAGQQQDLILSLLQDRVVQLTGLPREFVQGSEQLQVVKYSPGGHYNCHTDSEERDDDEFGPCCHLHHELQTYDQTEHRCRLCRYMTVLFFLNDVEEGGETAFPLADNKTLVPEIWEADEEDVCNLAQNCHKSNLVVKPEKGKAIMWYNHEVDPETNWLGPSDDRSFHGGCDVLKGAKWIANNWLNAAEERESDIRQWTYNAERFQAGYDLEQDEDQVEEEEEGEENEGQWNVDEEKEDTKEEHHENEDPKVKYTKEGNS